MSRPPASNVAENDVDYCFARNASATCCSGRFVSALVVSATTLRRLKAVMNYLMLTLFLTMVTIAACSSTPNCDPAKGSVDFTA